MDFIKQNIFHEIKGKSLQVKNIKENFGNRNIDVLTQRPIKIIHKKIIGKSLYDIIKKIN